MPSDQTRLESWKEIAAYLNREVRTARRWEKERGLPVHRIPGKRSGVYALAPEVDAWLKTDSNGSSSHGTLDVSSLQPPSEDRKLGRWAAAIGVFLLASVALLRPTATRSALPRLSHAKTITNDGWLKGGPLSRGGSLFFATGDPPILKRIDEGAGEASVVPFAFNIAGLEDVSHDGSQILVEQNDSGSCRWPLWVVPTNGGLPKRLADLCAAMAAWSADRAKLAFAVGNDLYLSDGDGRNSRRLLALPFETPQLMRWSPDGKHLRLIMLEGKGSEQFHRLWEVSVNEATIRRVLPGWSRTPSDHEFGGEWTPDGRYFIFAAVHQGTSAIWVVREKSSLLKWRENAPVQLATPTERVDSVALSRDGKKVFASVPRPRRGELLRFEPDTGRFLPYTRMSGVSGGQLAYSPDGKKVVYVTYPETSLETMNADGSTLLRCPMARW